jgi:hypothetical protein
MAATGIHDLILAHGLAGFHHRNRFLVTVRIGAEELHGAAYDDIKMRDGIAVREKRLSLGDVADMPGFDQRFLIRPGKAREQCHAAGGIKRDSSKHSRAPDEITIFLNIHVKIVSA